MSGATLRQHYLLNTSDVLINPATEDKQNSVIAQQTDGTQKSQVTNGTIQAGITANADKTTNLDGENGLNTNSMMFGRVDDNTVKNARLDAVSEANIIIDNAHHEIHEGSHYLHRDSHAIAKNGTVDYLIVTPNTTKWAHMIIGITGLDSSITVTLYEDTTVSANGTSLTVRNRNRNMADNNTTVVYLTPTVTAVGNVIAVTNLGSGENSGGNEVRGSEEIILKQNTNYLIRAQEDNIKETAINVELSWYEHISRN